MECRFHRHLRVHRGRSRNKGVCHTDQLHLQVHHEITRFGPHQGAQEVQEGVGTPREVQDSRMDDPQQPHLELPHMGDFQGLQRRHAEARRGSGPEEGELDVGGHGPSQRSTALPVDGIRCRQHGSKPVPQRASGSCLIIRTSFYQKPSASECSVSHMLDHLFLVIRPRYIPTIGGRGAPIAVRQGAPARQSDAA